MPAVGPFLHPTNSLRPSIISPNKPLKLSEPFLSDRGRVFLPRGDEPAPDVPGWFKLVDREYDLSSEIGLRRLAVYANHED